MSDETPDAVVRTFLPGDNIEMVVELFARANLRTIKAIFRKEEVPQGVLVCSSNVISVSKVRDGRLNEATVSRDRQAAGQPLPVGDYWLDEVSAETRQGKPVTVKYDGRLCLRLLSEPEDVRASITKLDFRE